jgi:AraC family transcriptional regulator
MAIVPAQAEPLRAPRQLSWLCNATVPLEPSLLEPPQAAAWTGFRLGISQALTSSAELHGEHAVVAMILRGRTRARILSRGEDRDVSPGRDSIGLFAPQLDVGWTRWQCEPGAQRIMIELDFSDLQTAGDLDQMLPARRALKQDLDLRDACLASLVRLIADEVRQGSPHGALYAASISLGLAAYLFTHQGSGGRAPPRERGTLTAAQKDRVLDLVRRRLAGPLGLDELAAAAGVSRFHFLRLFKNSLGITPHRFVLEQRVAAARRLLEETQLPLTDVAAATGFSSQSHLCTAMRRQLGLSPGQWRRSARPLS